ncbi:site-specific DNA-methyltransferase [Spirosoma fluviale]|uniref:site-specific DNA-methyltransferase (adenine-specific) n=1 Tax=Spirosoma fluviale TaxID=1597977 RepID=A0A286GW53_9BACT|nr:site-specific DNA-methyltransferase [Spirosoma fluviale]SOD99750.1 adenine-specific DNA-methyltransferase [Spirosoma fluviale]
MAKNTPTDKLITSFTHEDETRKNIPTAEYQSMMQRAAKDPVQVAYERRNRDLDPQLVWRGKDEQDWSNLMVQAPPLYIQEKVQPKALIDDLLRQSKAQEHAQGKLVADLFSDFNGIPNGVDKTEFYQHDQHWTNRMILGDSLQVMASLAEREGLRGKVQCIYFDPPYGIKFNSNFQWSTTSRDVKDGKTDHITREPEQVKAFRDTWRDGIHSYLTYLRDRLTVARDLLTDSGSIFVQIGDENVHRVRAVMDEVFGDENFVGLIAYAKTTGFSGNYLSSVCDYLIWFAKSAPNMKYRSLYDVKQAGGEGASKYRPASSIDALKNSPIVLTRLATSDQLTSQGESTQLEKQKFQFRNSSWQPSAGLHWKTTVGGLNNLAKAERIIHEGKSIRYVRFLDDFSIYPRTNVWLDIGGVQSRTDPKVYVVQTATEAVKRCILMASDPGDLVLDPTCGSGTAAYVAEQWGRRWITIDTSRVSLALARARIMGARYPFYYLADSPDGQLKEAEITRSAISTQPTRGNLRHGFVYERVPHITLKSIANNAEINVIWDKWQQKLEPLREALNTKLGNNWQEWEIPREAKPSWSDEATKLHADWWQARIARQKEIDASIAAKAESEYLYDKPYEDKKKVRVAGPFTVESLSPHRMLGVDENDELIDPLQVNNRARAYGGVERTFEQMILENLRTAGVQQAHKEDRITFTALTGWPGDLICAEGRYPEGDQERRAGIFIGPEFGTVQRADLVAAARECGDAGFDVLIACAFNYEAHATDFNKLGSIPVLKARMNADLHMADDLKNTGKGNLFVVFGEPDIDVLHPDKEMVQVKINGVDVFHPNTGEVRSDGAEGIACWFIDTDYNEESFFVRQAYFLGANDPYKALKTTLKAEINQEAWESLNSDVSRPFPKPKSGRIAVKVINHLGDEVMKVFRVA